ncbi:nitrate ABC transporter permease [Affinibrenneria salicis]|uniref:Nitrate ABC transporter permease n=1 Tax=Affinibrenneria salicis TaxID=2590031 RepID=A0A5J5G2Z9_9GAMM|nr:nitrate ABC transporter permease [Affinibrenneria salicis]KAA9001275.1 nitrate ABC transporter permease [Affinibrenneria salicis]
MKSLRMKSALLSLVLLLIFLLVWQTATDQPAVPPPSAADDEYAALMGQSAAPAAGADKITGMPTPAQFGRLVWQQLADPFYDNGPNDKGIGIQLAHSLERVGLGYLLAALAAIPLGFAIGMSPVLYRALDPFIQILKPISPLAWMPIALYTIKDAGASAIFVIFICSVWPMLINTAFGVAGVRKDWLNVARTLEVKPLRKALLVVLPAAAPTIITGMRISMGIAWLVIVAAEMLIGGTGIGYFVWNEWNNLSLGNVIFAVLMIGLIGMLLDLAFATLQKKVTYAE